MWLQKSGISNDMDNEYLMTIDIDMDIDMDI